MKSVKHKNGNALFLLILAAFVFVLLSHIPFGNLVQWPFVIITTFIHEMGHGLTAIAVGGGLNKVEIYYNGSGLAFTRTTLGWPYAATAAGGLLAPSIVGAIFISVGRNTRNSATTFLCLSLFILICCALWVRSSFGLIILLPIGLLFLLLSQKSSKGFQQFLIQFMGVHMLVDTFTRTLGYLFTRSVDVGGEMRHSDSSIIAENLVGGHLLWATIIAILSVGILLISLRKSYF
jgi:hypothetical protein